MPTVVFKSGKSIKVDYNQAATIRQYLAGETVLDASDSEYPRKKTFLDMVQNVYFDDIKYVKESRPWEKWIKNKRWYEQ